ncbi:MAG: FG-GAP-like repeat-containing protein, partial [Bacteroidota bacterium]
MSSEHDFTTVFLFQNTFTFTRSIQAGTGPRNLIIQVPISELNTDSRTALIEVTAGSVYESLETFSEDLGNSLKIFTVVLEDVPADVTEVEVVVTSRTTGLGDSFVVNGVDFGVQCSGNAPEAENDAASTDENTAVTIDILSNDFDADYDIDTSAITNLGVLDPQNGTVTFNASGQAVYTPDASFTGVDYFEYFVCDTTNLCDIATVTVIVNCSGGQFTEIADGLGINLGGSKDGGITWADFNNDGLMDVLVNTSNTINDSRLYFANDSTGTILFDDKTATHATGLTDNNTERTAIAADLTNDGYVDFVRNTFTRIEIWFNRGPGASPAYSFGDGSQAANIVLTSLTGGMNVEGMAFTDWNQDGWLDILLENHNNGIEILENNRDGTFTQQTAGTGAGETGFPASNSGDGDYSASIDYDNDGFIDFIARKSDVEDIYNFNESTGRYESIASPNLTAENGNKGAITLCDLDQDGDFDMIKTPGTGSNTEIYLQENGTFTFSSNLLSDGGIDDCDCQDIDNDGDNDIFLGDGGGDSWLFINSTPKGGALSFAQDQRCIDPSANTEGLEFVDYDNDGDMDLYINIGNGSNQLWANGQDDDNFLIVEPRYRISGSTWRPATGANVVLERCTDTCMIKQVGGGRGHGTQRAHVAHFGLGNIGGADSSYRVVVYFPDSNGVRQTVTQVIVPGQLPGQRLIIYQNDVDLNFCDDTDGDGIVDYLDSDTDNDGILDSLETSGVNPYNDSDGDGTFDYLDSDFAGCGGIVNGVCSNFDTDGDGAPDHLDLDSDNDGVLDLYESGLSPTLLTGIDANGDGVIDPGTISVGSNGMTDTLEFVNDRLDSILFNVADTDGDGISDRVDLDSDNDGITDLAESGTGTDANNDGI